MAETLRGKQIRASFLKAIVVHKGNISAACKAAGCSRSAYRRYMQNDVDFQNQIDDLIEGGIDYVEDKLLKAIDDGNITAIIYYLNNKGRARGYGHGFNDMKINIKNEAPQSENDNLNKALETIKEIRELKPQMKLIKADGII